MLVILNDNEMSISENVGALNNHLAKMLSGNLYTGLREGSKRLLKGIPPIKELASRAEEHLKGMV
jgi:1-deoxy-D-xylulose-5-phosphate synthase